MTVVLGLVAISILVFVHELGHFLAAKWAGAPVKTFALGFDPTVWGVRLKLASWKWGETEYVVGLIPFGGYVRPGDTSGEEEGKVGEFLSQPPLKRAVIFAAGATMNMIFGFAAFAVAFSMGVSFQSPEVGSVQPGSPAWYAGVRPGDRITALDGRPVEAFMDVAVSCALGGEKPHALTFFRAGERKTVSVVPRIDPVLGMPTVGVRPSISRSVWQVKKGASAEKAGIMPGDTILRCTFQPQGSRLALTESLPSRVFVESVSFLAHQNPGATFLLRVQTADGRVRDVTLSSTPAPQGEVPRVGIKQESRCVIFVRPGTEASRFFQPGDVIERINGVPVPVVAAQEIAETFPDATELHLSVERGQSHTVRKEKLLRWLLLRDIVTGPVRTTIAAVQPGSRADRAGLRPGDRILQIDTTPVGHEIDVEKHLGSGELEVYFRRAEAIQKTVLPPGDALGVTYDRRPLVGWVKPDSPAEQAGLRLGDRVVRLNGEDVTSWEDLVRIIHGAGEKPLTATVLRGEKGTTRWQCVLKPRKEPPGELGITFKEARVLVRRPGMVGAFTLGLKRTVLWIKRVLLTILRLFRGEVATRNLQGPVGIVYATGFYTSYGFGTLLYFLGLISINLAVLNLLPLPIFDGGHLLLLACERIKGSPVNEKLLQGATTVMLFLLIALAVYVTYNDILRILLS